MQITFASVEHPSRVARSLRRFLTEQGHPLPLRRCQEVVARMTGHRDWHGVRDASRPDAASPPDHVAGPEVAARRRRQYVGAIAAVGIPLPIAEAAVDAIRPTGGASPRSDANPSDLLSGRQADELCADGWTLNALDACVGLGRIVSGLQAMALDDPFWGLRGARMAYGPAGSSWLSGLMTDMRGNADHPTWRPLALLSFARMVSLLPPQGAEAGIAALSSRNPVALGAVLSDLDARTEGRIVALAMEEAPRLLARAHSEAGTHPAPGVSRDAATELPPPWRALSPFELARSVSTRWPAPLPGPEMPTECHVRSLGSKAEAAWQDFLSAAMELHPDDDEVGSLSLATPEDGPDTRTQVFLIKRISSTRVEAAIAVTTTVDPEARRQFVDVIGPVSLVEGNEPDFPGLLSDCLTEQLDADLTAWGRVVPPGGRLALALSPGPDGTGRGAFALDLADNVESRIANRDESHGDLGVDVLVTLARDDGGPCVLPGILRIVPPAGRAPAWAAYLDRIDGMTRFGDDRIVLHLVPGGVAVEDGSADPVPDAAVRRFLGHTRSRGLLSEIISEAGLGDDARLVVDWSFVAVFSADTWEANDWSGTFEAVLVEARPRTGAGRARDRERFWVSFPDELDLMIRRREKAPRPLGAISHPGTDRLQ